MLVATSKPVIEPATEHTRMSAFDVLRTSVGKSSLSSVAIARLAARRSHNCNRRDDPEDRTAGDEERHLEHGREPERDDRQGPPAATLGELARDHNADEPGRAVGHRA